MCGKVGIGTYMSLVLNVSPPLTTVQVGGFSTALADRDELAVWMCDVCEARPKVPALVFSSNGQGIALSGGNAKYDAAMSAADVIHADGMSVLMASKLLTNSPIRGRSATTDLFHDVARHAQERGLSFFVLGASEDQNARAVTQIRRLYPALNIVGRRNGYFEEAQSGEVCAQIVASGADVVWVGLGKPKQEIWCHENRAALAGVGCLKTCGGLYAFLAGDSSRAPKWVQRIGFEWLFRLMGDPSRLWRRYAITNAQAAVRLMRDTRSNPVGSPPHRPRGD